MCNYNSEWQSFNKSYLSNHELLQNSELLNKQQKIIHEIFPHIY